MKVIELFEAVDWNTKIEKEQIDLVTREGYDVQKITNPSENVQLAAVSSNPWVIRNIKHPSNITIKSALTNPDGICQDHTYREAVNYLFKDNTLLMKKWLRCGKAMREES